MHIEDRYLHQRSSSQESFDQILEGSSAFEYKGRWDTSKNCLDNIIKKAKGFSPRPDGIPFHASSAHLRKMSISYIFCRRPSIKMTSQQSCVLIKSSVSVSTWSSETEVILCHWAHRPSVILNDILLLFLDLHAETLDLSFQHWNDHSEAQLQSQSHVIIVSGLACWSPRIIWRQHKV